MQALLILLGVLLLSAQHADAIIVRACQANDRTIYAFIASERNNPGDQLTSIAVGHPTICDVTSTGSSGDVVTGLGAAASGLLADLTRTDIISGQTANSIDCLTDFDPGGAGNAGVLTLPDGTTVSANAGFSDHTLVSVSTASGGVPAASAEPFSRTIPGPITCSGETLVFPQPSGSIVDSSPTGGEVAGQTVTLDDTLGTRVGNPTPQPTPDGFFLDGDCTGDGCDVIVFVGKSAGVNNQFGVAAVGWALNASLETQFVQHTVGGVSSFYTLTPTPSPTITQTPTITPTLTPEILPQYLAPTKTITQTPSVTPTPTITLTPTRTPTRTPSWTPTKTITSTVTWTPSLTPTVTETPTPTRTPTNTPAETPAGCPAGQQGRVVVLEPESGGEDYRLSLMDSSWPPTGVAICATSALTVWARKRLAGGTYTSEVSIVNWRLDTVAPDATSVVSAEVQFYNAGGGNVDDMSIRGGWFTSAPPCDSSHYVTEVAETALSPVALSTLTGGLTGWLPLNNADTNVNLTGRTAIRFGLGPDGAPTGNDNLFQWRAFEASTGPPAQLRVNYCSPADTPTPTVTVTPTPNETPPEVEPQYLRDTRTHTPTSTPTPTPTTRVYSFMQVFIGPTATPTPTQGRVEDPIYLANTLTPTPTPTLTRTPTVSATPTETPTLGPATATPTLTHIAEPQYVPPSRSPTLTPTLTGTATPTGSHTATTTATPTATSTATPTPTGATPTPTPTLTHAVGAQYLFVRTPSGTPTRTQTRTKTPWMPPLYDRESDPTETPTPTETPGGLPDPKYLPNTPVPPASVTPAVPPQYHLATATPDLGPTPFFAGFVDDDPTLTPMAQTPTPTLTHRAGVQYNPHTEPPTATPTGPTMTPTRTFTATLTATMLATATPTFAAGIASCLETKNTVPVEDAGFLSNLQTFLCEEDGERFRDYANGFVASGGTVSSTAGGTIIWSSPLLAYAGGFVLTENANLTVSAASATCWIAADAEVSGNNGVFVRAPGTHWLIFCGSTKPTLPGDAIWILDATVDSGGTITSTTDLRNRNPHTISVKDASELPTLLGSTPHDNAIVRRGTLAIDLSTNDSYIWTGAVFEKILHAEDAVTTTGSETISGTKTFTSFPRKSGSTTPTLDSELATKEYVDDRILQGSMTWDTGTIAASGTATVSATVTGVGETSVCAATHSQFDADTLLLSAHVDIPNTVRVVAFNPTGAGITPASGTLAVKCIK